MVQRLFENADFILTDKPPLVLTTPARDDKDPRPCLGRSLQREAGVQIYPVHRLDFEVSGLVLWAKSKDAHRAAQSWFEHGRVRKTYEAVAQGPADPGDWQDWRSKLVRGKRRAFEADHGKEALTRARVMETSRSLSRWELMPLTGRPHQLRFEMSKHDHPICGDTLYGGAASADGRIYLRAVRLSFSEIALSERFGLPEEFMAQGLSLP